MEEQQEQVINEYCEDCMHSYYKFVVNYEDHTCNKVITCGLKGADSKTCFEIEKGVTIH